jgi:hypothetical protein
MAAIALRLRGHSTKTAKKSANKVNMIN